MRASKVDHLVNSPSGVWSQLHTHIMQASIVQGLGGVDAPTSAVERTFTLRS